MSQCSVRPVKREILDEFCWNFNSLPNGAKIVKTGPHLTKLSPIMYYGPRCMYVWVLYVVLWINRAHARFVVICVRNSCDTRCVLHASVGSQHESRAIVCLFVSLPVLCVSAYGAVLPDFKWMSEGRNKLIICWKGDNRCTVSRWQCLYTMHSPVSSEHCDELLPLLLQSHGVHPLPDARP